MSRNYAVVDVETTGLDPRDHEIIEIGIVECTSLLQVVKTYEAKVFPKHIETADPIALKINGYDPEVWAKEAIPLEQALAEVIPLLEDNQPVGHNIGFDLGFLRAAFESCGIYPKKRPQDKQERETFWHYKKVDTMSLAAPMERAGMIQSSALKHVAAALGIHNPHPHRAMSDAWTEFKVLKLLLEKFASVLRPDHPALYIALAGPDGAGKTQATRKVAWKLRERGISVKTTYEPTRTKYGAMLRETFSSRLPTMEEFWLFMLDRAEHGREVVTPALKIGQVVLSDRSGFCTMAYQGPLIALETHSGVEEAMTMVYDQWKASAPIPDVVVLLDVEPEEAVRRLSSSREDLDEFETASQIQGYRDGYRTALGLFGEAVVEVDTMGKTLDEVADEVVEGLMAILRPEASS